MAIPVILIFDVGKTNKKVLLFDEQYNIVFEESINLEETKDEDGFNSEDVGLLTEWIKKKFSEIAVRKDVTIKAINFSAYGASFVNLDENFNCCTPLYNYLKPFPENLKKQFYDTYGGESLIAQQTASPILGSLNSGMQLYRLKYEHPEVYKKIKYALHLPQYISFILSKKTATDISSVGCHTNLWNFEKNDYHDWVYKEELDKKFSPFYSSDKIIASIKDDTKVGIGLHDSSAALIPYLITFSEPFVLISTGTWNISLSPFNHSPLTDEELTQDCLCYLSYQGSPVKASRLFAGHEHEQQVKRIAEYFNQSKEKYYALQFDKSVFNSLNEFVARREIVNIEKFQLKAFAQRDLSEFKNDIEAYYQLIIDLVALQFASTELILKGSSVKKIFVDGGFSRNEIYMHLLSLVFRGIEVFAATVAQASAAGAALAIHEHWNKKVIPNDLIKLKSYAGKQ